MSVRSVQNANRTAVFALLACLPLLSSVEAAEVDNERNFEDALVLISAGRPIDAAAKLQELYTGTRSPRVRLEWARALLLANRPEEARALFVAAFEETPPAPVRATILRLIEQIDRRAGRVTLSVSMARIQNPLHTPSNFTVTFAGTTFVSVPQREKQTLWGVTWQAGYEKSFDNGYDYRLTGAFRDMKQTFADYENVDLSFGKISDTLPVEIRGGFQGFRMEGQSWRLPYAEMSWRKSLSSLITVVPRAQAGWFSSVDAPGMSGATYRFLLPLEIAPSPNRQLSVGLKGEIRDARFKEQSYWSIGPVFETTWGYESFALSLAAQPRVTKFTGKDPFWGTTRYDRSLYASISITTDKLRYKGMSL